MSSNDDLDDIMSELEQSYQHYFPSIVENYHRQRKNVIITLCMNGEGGAIQIKKYLEDSVDYKILILFHYQWIIIKNYCLKLMNWENRIIFMYNGIIWSSIIWH